MAIYFFTEWSLFIVSLFVKLECLWRDLWGAVTSKNYTVVHNLEEEGFSNLSDLSVYLFCLGYIFIPILQADLLSFIQTWNRQPLRTEGTLTPKQNFGQ